VTGTRVSHRLNTGGPELGTNSTPQSLDQGGSNDPPSSVAPRNRLFFVGALGALPNANRTHSGRISNKVRNPQQSRTRGEGWSVQTMLMPIPIPESPGRRCREGDRGGRWRREEFAAASRWSDGSVSPQLPVGRSRRRTGRDQRDPLASENTFTNRSTLKLCAALPRLASEGSFLF